MSLPSPLVFQNTTKSWWRFSVETLEWAILVWKLVEIIQVWCFSVVGTLENSHYIGLGSQGIKRFLPALLLVITVEPFPHHSIVQNPKDLVLPPVSVLLIPMPRYLFFVCFFLPVSWICSRNLVTLRMRVKDKVYWRCHLVGWKLNVLQPELLHNWIPSQPCKAANYCLGAFANSYLCYSKEVYLGSSIFKLFSEKLL